jgi:hypothetical protein
MTISSTTRVAGPYTGNGTASAFPFAWKVFAAGDVNVYRTLTSTGVVTTLVLNSDYTVSLNVDQNSSPGGTVTLTGGNLATGTTLLIASDVANTQQVDLTNQGGFYPEVINDALDRATIQVQQVQEQVNRGIRYPDTEISLNAVLPKASDRANQYLAFDSNGAVDIGGAVPDQRYYGSKTSDPATRNDGTARQAGDLYFNSVSNVMKVFNGSAWDTVTTTPVDGDKGDITISGGGATYTIDNGAVTSAKLDTNIAVSGTLSVGSTASVTSDMTVGGDLTVTGNDIKASGGTTAITLSGADVAIAGDLTVTGNDIKSSGGTTVITLSSDDAAIAGDLTMTAGNVIVADTKGIDFSATANGSGTPTTEVLSDYEEGTWVPVYEAETGAFTTLTYTTQSGRYTKIGNMVIVSGIISTSNVAVGTAGGGMFIGGMPYPQSGTLASGTISLAINWNTDHPSNLEQDSGNSRMKMLYRSSANGGSIALAIGDFTTGATADRNRAAFTATYWTA